MFCLLVVLAKLSLLAKWLDRKTPLRKPNRGEGIISIKPRPKSVHDFLGLLYCFIVFYVFVLSPAPTWYIILLLWHDIYSLFVLKVPLNPKQTNKQTHSSREELQRLLLRDEILLWAGCPSRYPYIISHFTIILLLHYWRIHCETECAPCHPLESMSQWLRHGRACLVSRACLESQRLGYSATEKSRLQHDRNPQSLTASFRSEASLHTRCDWYRHAGFWDEVSTESTCQHFVHFAICFSPMSVNRHELCSTVITEPCYCIRVSSHHRVIYRPSITCRQLSYWFYDGRHWSDEFSKAPGVGRWWCWS